MFPRSSIPEAVIDATLRHVWSGTKFPNPGSVIADRALLSLLRSNGTPGIATRVEVDGLGWNASATHFGPRLWIRGNWNTDAPILEGSELLAAVRCAFGLGRPAGDPGVEFDPPYEAPVPAGALQAAAEQGVLL